MAFPIPKKVAPNALIWRWKYICYLWNMD